MRSKADYREKILALLEERGPGKTICPSECLAPEKKTDKKLMAEVRECARQLVSEGRIEITQKGRVIDPSSIHGPIRLRKKN